MTTISDEELYRLAVKCGPRTSTKADLFVVNYIEYKELTSLRDAVIQRFKPREPRVVESYGLLGKDDDFIDYGEREFAEIEAKNYPDCRLAKAVITEVMEGVE